MNIQKNAALAPNSRAEVARAFCICAKTAAKWFRRFRSGGESALAGTGLSGILCGGP